MADYVDDTAKLKELSVMRTFNTVLPTAQHQTPTEFVLKSNVKLGAWAHAMVCEMNLQTAGAVHGVGSAGTSILVPPNGSLERGALYAHIFEIGCQASSTWGSAGPVGFLKFDQWGTATHFDPNAFFMDIQGLNEGSGNMFSAGAGGQTAAATLKIRIGSTTYYIMLSSAESN